MKSRGCCGLFSLLNEFVKWSNVHACTCFGFHFFKNKLIPFPDFNWISWNHWLKSFFSMFTKNDHLLCFVINFFGHHVTCWFDFDVFIHVLLLLVYFSFFWSKWLISIYLLASVSTDLHKNALKNSWTWIYKKILLRFPSPYLSKMSTELKLLKFHILLYFVFFQCHSWCIYDKNKINFRLDDKYILSKKKLITSLAGLVKFIHV